MSPAEWAEALGGRQTTRLAQHGNSGSAEPELPRTSIRVLVSSNGGRRYRTGVARGQHASARGAAQLCVADKAARRSQSSGGRHAAQGGRLPTVRAG